MIISEAVNYPQDVQYCSLVSSYSAQTKNVYMPEEILGMAGVFHTAPKAAPYLDEMFMGALGVWEELRGRWKTTAEGYTAYGGFLDDWTVVSMGVVRDMLVIGGHTTEYDPQVVYNALVDDALNYRLLRRPLVTAPHPQYDLAAWTLKVLGAQYENRNAQRFTAN